MTAPKRRWSGFLIAAFTVCGMMLLGMVAVPYAITEGHAVSMTSLDRVRTGMSEDEVRQTLGNPPSTELRFGKTLWTYHSWTWCAVRIGFGQDGTVDEIDHDH
jgi:outer membrane protein assembly factor BamE (lipoprotein component of BamABCDE complex)